MAFLFPASIPSRSPFRRLHHLPHPYNPRYPFHDFYLAPISSNTSPSNNDNAGNNGKLETQPGSSPVSGPPLVLTRRVYAREIDSESAKLPVCHNGQHFPERDGYDDKNKDIEDDFVNEDGVYGYKTGRRRIMEILEGGERHMSWWIRGGGWTLMKRRRVGDPPCKYFEVGFGWIEKRRQKGADGDVGLEDELGGDEEGKERKINGRGRGWGWDGNIRDAAEPRIRGRGGLRMWYKIARKWGVVGRGRLEGLGRGREVLRLAEERIRPLDKVKNLRYKDENGNWVPFRKDQDTVPVQEDSQLQLDGVNGSRVQRHEVLTAVFGDVTDEQGMVEAEVDDDEREWDSDQYDFNDLEDYKQSPTEMYQSMLELKKQLGIQDLIDSAGEDSALEEDFEYDEDGEKATDAQEYDEEDSELDVSPKGQTLERDPGGVEDKASKTVTVEYGNETGVNLESNGLDDQKLRQFCASLHEERIKRWLEKGPHPMQSVWQRPLGRSPRVIVIGDVHGCIKELTRLLRLADFRPGDQVIFLGDLVAKGPDSVAVVKLAREIGAKSVRGNHDHEVVRWGEARRLGLSETWLYPNSEHAQIAAALRPLDHKWLLECPWFITLPDLEYIFVHGGFIPGIGLMQQNPRLMMNMRSVLENGSVTSRNIENRPWGRLWPGPETVVFGHDALRGLQRHKYALGIDTGCVYGGRLTALLLPENRLVSVDAERAYVIPRRRRKL